MAKALILEELISYLDIPIAKFERKIGVPNTVITQAIRRNSEIKVDTVNKIRTAYPFVSENWLLTGEPPMIIEEKDENNNNNTTKVVLLDKKISLDSQSTKTDDMDRTLIEIVRMQVENDRQHAKNYADLIDLLKRDISKEKAS